MKHNWLWLILVCAVLLSGCKMFGDGEDKAETKSNGGGAVAQKDWPTPSPPLQPAKPDNPSQGKVAMVDTKLGFVVVDFTYSALPAANLRFHVYRQGRLIGEVTTTAQKDDAFLVADINKGEIQKGDDVRP